jgi:hypothetical protein
VRPDKAGAAASVPLVKRFSDEREAFHVMGARAADARI